MPKEDTQFKPGQSGNPAGRPKGSKNFTTKVREALEKISKNDGCTYEEALIKSIIAKAIIDGDTRSQKLIWNYLDGMPQQNVKLDGDMKVTQKDIETVSKSLDESGY